MNLKEDIKLIDAYSRAQAIEDKVLIDVTKTAKEVGYKFPVAISAALWSMIKDVPKSKYGGDPEGRMWDVLCMGYMAIRRNSNSDTVQINYKLILPHIEYCLEDDKRKEHLKIYQTLKIILGPDDDFQPCLTIMLQNED